jgi:hypothetical protein
MEVMLTHETFSALLNTKFNVELTDDQQVELELSEVSELKLSDRQEQFAIVFLGPNQVFLGQGLRRFNHEQTGSFELFLVPVAQDARGYSYESVFNRILKLPGEPGNEAR